MSLKIRSGNSIVSQKQLSGKSRDWQSLTVNLPDDTTLVLAGVSSLKYAEKQDVQLNYGIGVYPISRGYGNVSATGEITFAVYQLEELLSKVVGITVDTQRPQNIAPFDLVVVWTASEDGSQTKDVLYGCTIDNFEKSITQNQMNMEVTVNLNPISVA